MLIDAGADRATAIKRWDGPPAAMGRPAITRRLVERGFARPGDAGPGA